MRIAVGSDERTLLTVGVLELLTARGVGVELFGPLAGEPWQWARIGLEVGRAVASRRCDQGVLFCWTGTGMSIAADKVLGVRAALCDDAETAQGARLWNHANVLALSLRRTSISKAREILDAWFAADEDSDEARNVAALMEAETARIHLQEAEIDAR